jgi:selenocysteine-specific elongation factor
VARHVVIGTAGHVDHGKTALVEALTGIDTDRWEEEKRRGITIDLGFAHCRLSDDATASIVDVPGHEDFVRNMVAGATGIDVALLVIAGDEGVMPQTVEHLAILEFLGVRAGVVAVTKVDLVEAEWLDLVVDDLGDRLAESEIAWEVPVPASVRSGRGLDGIRASLLAAAEKAAERNTGDLFRMPVDRAFSVAGAGTVVTGTTWAGTVGTGNDVRILNPGCGVWRCTGKPRRRPTPDAEPPLPWWGWTGPTRGGEVRWCAIRGGGRAGRWTCV